MAKTRRRASDSDSDSRREMENTEGGGEEGRMEKRRKGIIQIPSYQEVFVNSSSDPKPYNPPPPQSSFVKSSQFYTPPPQYTTTTPSRPVVEESQPASAASASNSNSNSNYATAQDRNAILVSHRQKGNPLRAFADVVCDYLLEQSSCALYSRHHMDPSENEEGDASPKKMKRGATTMKDLTLMANEGKRLDVKYNSFNQPIDRNSEKLASYVGAIVRQHVPIDIENWHRVSKELKNKIWIDVKRAFTLGEERKHGLLKAAGKQWKGFKTILTKMYIAKGLTAKPPHIYNFIEQEIWEKFVNNRTSERFKALSAKNKVNQSKYKYKGRIGRKGYARFEQQLLKERSTNSETPISSIERSEIWCLARLKPDGTYTTDACKEVVERIESLTQSVSQGIIHPSGVNDVLTMAIGTEEHPGRVRAVGQAVPIRTYFREPRQRRGSMTNEEMDRLLDVKVNAMKEKLMDEINLKYNLIPRASPHHVNDEVGNLCPPPKSGYDSCTVSKDLSQLSEGSFFCDLAIDHDTDKLVVARGKVYDICGGDQFLHNQPLGVDNVRVSILKIIVDGALLPFPTEDIKYVGNVAIGSFFAWPKRLVIQDTETRDKEKVVACRPSDGGSLLSKGSMSVNRPKHNATKDDRMPLSLKALHKIAMMMKVGEVSTIHMHAAIFGHEHTMPIDRSEILQLIGKKEIGAACISIYMKYLFELCEEMNIRHMYGFICPHNIAFMSMTTRTDKANHIANVMSGCEPGCLYFVPYNAGGHWILCVIDPHKTIVYWLDPLLGNIHENIEDVINSAVTIFISTRGNKSVHPTNISTKWRLIQCPHQPDSMVCGYYVMRFMREIIASKMKSILIKFNSKLGYTDEEVDEVREELAHYIIEMT